VAGGPETEQAGLRFGGLLRQLRAQAGLTQDELAEAARVSQRAISDLERGINATARKDTAALLAGALGLDGPARELFVAAARGRAPAAEALAAAAPAAGGPAAAGPAAAAARTLPRDIAAFTGRQAELGQLMARWAEAAAADGGGVVSVHAIGGMAGIGKTTFAVHAAHQIAGDFPDGQFFLPLHAHTPGQRPVDPADGLASLLLAAGVAAAQIPPGVEARAARWRDYLAGKKVLLVLDDAAGHDQVRPLLPGTPGSLVLITSRRRLAALDDAAVVSLDTLAPGEAAALLARLAGRPGLQAADAGVGEITRLCGYLPLAIGMLGRQLAHHPAWTPAGLAGDLAAARNRLELMAAENLSVAAAFGLSYKDLPAGQQRLFRRLGLHPGPDIDVHAAAALDGTTLDAGRRGLEVLYGQHLITEPAPGRYRLHDLFREHAQTLAAGDDPATRDAAAGRLLDYYLHTALAAGGHIPPHRFTSASLPPARPPDCAPPISTQAQAWIWLEDERVNLYAAVGYAAATARTQHAMVIPAAITSFLYLGGYWDQDLALQQMALAAARQAGDRPGQGQILLRLGTAQAMADDRGSAAATFRQALALYRDLGDPAGQGDALNGIGFVCWVAGDYPAAAASNRQALELFRGLGHRRGQANALVGLGDVYQVTGNYRGAAASHRQALELFRAIGHRTGENDALGGLAVAQMLTGDYRAAAAAFEQAMALQRDVGDRFGQAWVLHYLGQLQRLTGDYRAAAASQQQAHEVLCDLGERQGQASVLNELGLVQQLTGNYAAAAASHQQALEIFRDLSDRENQAEVLNSLGELSSRTAASQQARDYHNQALAIARDLGVPLEVARALEGIGHSHLRDGNPTQAAAPLRDALTTYQRIGSSAARHVEETLRQQELSTASAPPAHGQKSAHQRRRPPHSSPLGIEQRQRPADPAT
jgi:tetratricopeptide (TPR) repeat protein/transcriptional regulator with XRE-family HTH domain